MSLIFKSKFSVATKIVATDGSGDFDNINDALDSLPAGGGVVYVKEGNYPISAKSLTTSNVSIIGAGYSTYIYTSGWSAYVFHLSNVSNVVLKNFRISSTSGGATESISISESDHCVIENIWVLSSHSTGIEIWKSTDCIICNNHISAAVRDYDTGIEIDGSISSKSLRNIIIGNSIIDSDLKGIYLDEYCEDNVIIGNILDLNAPDYGNGIYLNATCNNNLFFGNLISDLLNCVYIVNASCNKNTFGGNKFSGYENAGIVDNGTNTNADHN